MILRDISYAQSFILKELLLFSTESHSGSKVQIHGIEMGCNSVPFHNVHLESDLVTGLVKLEVHSQLPIEDVGLILGKSRWQGFPLSDSGK